VFYGLISASGILKSSFLDSPVKPGNDKSPRGNRNLRGISTIPERDAKDFPISGFQHCAQGEPSGRLQGKTRGERPQRNHGKAGPETVEGYPTMPHGERFTGEIAKVINAGRGHERDSLLCGERIKAIYPVV